jgi:hypothetical protein
MEQLAAQSYSHWSHRNRRVGLDGSDHLGRPVGPILAPYRVMSRPVGVSSRLARLKPAGHERSPVQRIMVRSTQSQPLRCFSFTKCVHNLRTRVEDRIRDGKATGLANLHVAARITRGARQLRLRIDATWCWAIAIATAWHRFRAAFPRPADRPVPTTTKEPRPWKARPTRRHGQ